MLVNEIIDKFGKFINFWYDELSGVAIGMSFSDELLNGRDIVVNAESLKYMQKVDETSVATDIDSIIQQVMTIGGNIIHSMNRR